MTNTVPLTLNLSQNDLDFLQDQALTEGVPVEEVFKNAISLYRFRAHELRQELGEACCGGGCCGDGCCSDK